jgi:hypothetical protein
MPASKAQQAAYTKMDKKNLAEWPKKMKAIKIDEASMAECRKVGGEPLWNQWVAENKGEIPAQELLDLVLSTSAKATKKYMK